MAIMEFEDLQRIWDSQNNQPLYAINESALHRRITSKKDRVNHTLNFTEWILIIINIAGSAFVLVTNLINSKSNTTLFVLGAWMFTTALLVIFWRIRRINRNETFDRSMQGDLQHAIRKATYQVRLSYLMRWNVVPMSLITVTALWESKTSIWIIIGIIAVFVLGHFASGWESNIYKNRKRELENLQTKLEQE